MLEHGFAIPDEVALASFDTLEWLPNQPPMWVAEQPAYDLGSQAAHFLLARIAMGDRPA